MIETKDDFESYSAGYHKDLIMFYLECKPEGALMMEDGSTQTLDLTIIGKEWSDIKHRYKLSPIGNFVPKKLFCNRPTQEINMENELIDLVPGFDCFDFTKHPRSPDISIEERRTYFVGLYDLLYFYLDKKEFEVLDRIYRRTILRDYTSMYMTKKSLHQGLEFRTGREGYPMAGCDGLKDIMTYSQVCTTVKKLLAKKLIIESTPHEDSRLKYYGLYIPGINYYISVNKDKVEVNLAMKQMHQAMKKEREQLDPCY